MRIGEFPKVSHYVSVPLILIFQYSFSHIAVDIRSLALGGRRFQIKRNIPYLTENT
jgi:hypothetical protein